MFQVEHWCIFTPVGTGDALASLDGQPGGFPYVISHSTGTGPGFQKKIGEPYGLGREPHTGYLAVVSGSGYCRVGSGETGSWW
jgi:hypothetical protein